MSVWLPSGQCRTPRHSWRPSRRLPWRPHHTEIDWAGTTQLKSSAASHPAASRPSESVTLSCRSYSVRRINQRSRLSASIAFVYTYKHVRLTLTQHYDPACRRRALKIPRVDVHSDRPSADDDRENGRSNAGRWARPKTRLTHWQRMKGAGQSKWCIWLFVWEKSV